MLRAKRRSVAIPFRWLCIVMHAAVVALLIFVSNIITIFGELVAKAEASIPTTSGVPGISSFSSFNIEGLSVLNNMVLPLVIIFTIANSLAPYMVEGGSWLKVMYNLGITCALSGLAILCLPGLARMLFTTVTI
jgi:flagellar protein FlaJ